MFVLEMAGVAIFVHMERFKNKFINSLNITLLNKNSAYIPFRSLIDIWEEDIF